MEKDFDIGEAIKVGWGMMKDNLGFFIVLCIVYMVVEVISQVIAGLGQGTEAALPIIVTWLISTLISTYIYFGAYYKIPLAFCDKEKAEISDLAIPMNTFLNMFICYICYTLIVLAGIVLLIVPGIIFAIMFRMSFFLILDKGYGPIEALKESAKLTKGVRGKLFLLGIMQFLVVLAGFLCLIVGLFAAVPTVIMAEVYVYRKLLQDHEGGGAPASDSPPISPVAS